MAGVTDASTNISLPSAWTEQTTVAFTAGSIENMGQMVQQVELKLQRGTLTGTSKPTSMDVRKWLQIGKQKFLKKFPFTFRRRYVYADTTTDTYRYGLPADYGGGHCLRDITNDLKLTFYLPHKYDLKFPDPSEEATGNPVVYTIKNNELWLDRPATGSIRLEFEYDRTGDDNTAQDVTYLPETARFDICNFAIYHAFSSLYQWREAGYYKGEWMESIQDEIKEDTRKKWQAADRAHSWIERESARYNQS